MAFSGKTKLLARIKAAFRCCICHDPFVEVHHIIPQANGGDDSLNNAAPLCSSCHDLYGGNPEKQRIIRQMRDHWWKTMEERQHKLTGSLDLDKFAKIATGRDFKGSLQSRGVAIYHLVLEDDDFEASVDHLHRQILYAQQTFPGRKRSLYLDIDGHRNSDGGFDHDMFELQRHFLLGFLSPFLSELYMPLISVKTGKLQRNDIPEKLEICTELNAETLNRAIDEGFSGVWVSDKDRWLEIE